MDDLAKSGPEFLVNTTTAGQQANSAVAAMPDGTFVVVWSDFSGSPDDSDGAVRGQVFAADGSKLGSEFLVNTSTFGVQTAPIVTGLSTGGFVVAWTSIASGNADIRAQLFDASGTKVGSEFVANSTTPGFQIDPTITSLADGGFVVSWADGFSDVRAQVFDDSGAAVGSEFIVNTNTGGTQLHVALGALSGGGFAAAWTDQSNSTARTQIFDAAGNKIGSEIIVSTASNQDGPSVIGLADDSFVVLWKELDVTFANLKGQVFNADGTPSGSSFLVSNTAISDSGTPRGDVIGVLDDGRFVVAWTDGSQTGSDTSGEAVHAQVFNTDGSKSGAEILVNSTVEEGQIWPSVTVLADGNVLIAWTDVSQSGGDTSDLAIRAQIFSVGEPNALLTGNGQANTLVGGAGDDTITGLGRGDTLTGAGGADIFVYTQVSDSTGRSYDTITDFDASADVLDLWYQVTGVDAAVVSGTLRSNHINMDLASAVGATELSAHHAVLFTPDSGSLSGETFLIVDANGIDGYQARQDLVILLGGSSSLGDLDVADFV